VFVWDGDGRPRVWTPDFYLTQFGIYLEVCGSKEFDMIIENVFLLKMEKIYLDSRMNMKKE